MKNQAILDILANNGIKATPNRILVIKELSQATNPVSLADLEEALDFSVDKASIFRVLELLGDKDIIHVIEDGSRSLKYELCPNHNHDITDQHAHFFCENCKKTFCISTAEIPVIDIPPGFKPTAINYLVKGLCPDCNAH